jgi:hypothetical protein
LTRFRDDAEFGQAIEVAAGQAGVLPVVIEKDYYVTQALRTLAAKFPDDWVFKGGTSLSKAFGLLDRFSEDIDVLVLRRDRARGAVDRVMKGMGDAAAADIEAECRGQDASRGIHRSYQLHYPASHGGSAVLPYVLLEMGVRGGPEPHEARPIGTMLAQELELDEGAYEDLRPFDVPALHPGRTLIEKLGLLHVAAMGLQAGTMDPRAARIGRHFYDVHQILGYEPARELLADRDEVARIIAEAAAISEEQFGNHEPPPKGGYANSPAFGARTEAADAVLRAAYEDAQDGLRLGPDPWPTWDAVQARVAEHAHLL